MNKKKKELFDIDGYIYFHKDRAFCYEFRQNEIILNKYD